jgi:hypothetical protein
LQHSFLYGIRLAGIARLTFFRPHLFKLHALPAHGHAVRPPHQASASHRISNMSNLSDIQHISDTLDTCAPAHGEESPSPINAYPLLGLVLILSSAALTCGAAYYFLAG